MTGHEDMRTQAADHRVLGSVMMVRLGREMMPPQTASAKQNLP